MDITTKDILEFQANWAKAIVDIGVSFRVGGNYHALAEALVDNMYAYELGPVLFKPTLAREVPVRLRKGEAVSYFVAGSIAEDKGFALKPWSKIVFEQPHFALPHLAMGLYRMYPHGGEGDSVLAEYSMGFIRTNDRTLKLNLHHSSLPYAG